MIDLNELDELYDAAPPPPRRMGSIQPRRRNKTALHQ